jgi:hypothetical protein
MNNYKSSGYFGSPTKALIDNLLRFYDLEMGMMSNDLIDSLTPSIKSMEAIQIILQMQLELADYIKEKGKSDKALKSAKRLLKLYDCVQFLNRLTGDLNTLQLTNRDIYSKIQLLRVENADIKKQLSNMIKAHKEL